VTGGPDRTRQLKGILLVLGILILGGIIAMFSLQRSTAPADKKGETAAKNRPTISLEGLHHTGIRNGVKEWLLDAESADYRLEENRAYLSVIEASFFDSDGETVHLSADSGVLKTDSNDLEVSGNVVLKNSQYVMRTDRLLYTESERLFSTLSPVEIRSFSMTQVADGMTYSLETKLIILDGNLEGEFGNGIEF
jgi:LPS export ABC transporter protein LptC